MSPVVAFRFFDLDIHLHSDTAIVSERICSIYHCFLVPENVPPARWQSRITLVSANPLSGESPILVVDGFTQRLESPSEWELEAIVYEAILRTILRKVRSHYLIHAGAVSAQGRAVIIAADALHGKSTLTMELVRRGYRFLSDEFAAIGRVDGRAYPFPRSLRLCPDTLNRLGYTRAAQTTPIWLGKTLIDIEAIQPGSRGEAADIGHIIVLKDLSGLTDATASKEARWIGLFVDCAPTPFLEDLRKLSEVKSILDNGAGTAQMLELVVTSKQAALPGIRAVCLQYQVTLHQVYTRKDAQPSFDQPARLTEISKSCMTMELVKRLMGGLQSELIQEELEGNPRRLFSELAGLLQPARCWELAVGPLEQMADLVCGLPVGEK